MKFQMNSSVEKIWRRKREKKKTARILSRDPATAAASDRALASDSSPSPLRASQASASSPPALFPILPRASRSGTTTTAGRSRAGEASPPPPAAGSTGMAYVDHAFSITDDDDLVGGAVGGPRGAPVKEIAFAAALLAFGVLGVVAGSFMAAHQVGGDSAHGETETCA